MLNHNAHSQTNEGKLKRGLIVDTFMKYIVL